MYLQCARAPAGSPPPGTFLSHGFHAVHRSPRWRAEPGRGHGSNLCSDVRHSHPHAESQNSCIPPASPPPADEGSVAIPDNWLQCIPGSHAHRGRAVRLLQQAVRLYCKQTVSFQSSLADASRTLSLWEYSAVGRTHMSVHEQGWHACTACSQRQGRAHTPGGIGDG